LNFARVSAVYAPHLWAIFPESAQDIPKAVTPEYVAAQFLILEYGAVSALIREWLSAGGVAPQQTMTVSAIEAVKVVVSAGMGMSIVPAMSVAEATDEIVVRPLKPPLRRTLALIQHRNKPDDLALRMVRDALMELGNIPHAKKPTA